MPERAEHANLEHENLTVGEFCEEFWPLFFFGLFFMGTMFLPLLMMDSKNWMLFGILGTLVVAALLIAYSVSLGRHKSSH